MGWVENASPEVEALSQWRTIFAVCIVLSALSITCVSLRLWVRHSARGLAADDWLSALSMVCALVYSVLCICQTRYGLGLPLTARPPENLVVYTRLNYAGRPFYQLGISFFKLALLISYLRLLQGTDKRTYRIVVWCAIALIFLAHVGCTLALVFACNPVEKSWNPRMVGTCLPNDTSFTGYAVVTIVSDVLVALLPIPLLLKLNVTTRKKIGLIGIFLLGLFTTVCSILRYLQINRITYGDGNSTMLILWGTIEFNVGNMVSSLPFLAPVFMRKAKEYRSKMSQGYYGSGSGGGSGGGGSSGASGNGSRNRSRLGFWGGGRNSRAGHSARVTAGSKSLGSLGSGNHGGSICQCGGVRPQHQGYSHGGYHERKNNGMMSITEKSLTSASNSSRDDITPVTPAGNHTPAHSIVKSVAYSVRVEEDPSRPNGGGAPAKGAVAAPVEHVEHHEGQPVLWDRPIQSGRNPGQGDSFFV